MMKSVIIIALIIFIFYIIFKNYNKQSKTVRFKQANSEETYLEALIDGLRSKGIGALKEMNDEGAGQIDVWSGDVVRRYGEVLEQYPTSVTDIKLLPFPKEDIKIALKVKILACILYKKTNTLELLKTGYMQLGSFQEINPEDMDDLNVIESKKRLAGKLKNIPESVDYIRNDEKVDLKNLVDQYLNTLPTFNKYMDKINSETKSLSEEIEVFIAEIKASLE